MRSVIFWLWQLSRSMNYAVLLTTLSARVLLKLTLTEAQHQVAVFNEFAKKCIWLDFDLVSYSPDKLLLKCGIDLLSYTDAELEFRQVFVASVLATWTTDTSTGPVIRILEGSEAVSLNMQYQVERGYHLFAFQPEYLAKSVYCVVAAKRFTWRNLKDI